MGSQVTKSITQCSTKYYLSTCEKYKDIEEINESISATPFLTSEASYEEIREQYMNAKSASEKIGWIPLEDLSVAALKLADLSIERSETNRPAIETPLKHHLVLDIEPRSPNVEMQSWNPVIVSACRGCEFPAIIENKNKEKVVNVEVCSGTMKSTVQCRIPLGPINGQKMKNSNIDMLKLTPKLRKQVKVSSKIPVFKGKKIKVRCENIPQRNMMPNIESSKKTRWVLKD